MTDLSGRDVGGYRLLSLLGKGGMGEVYRAHDSTLGRDVAIKVLPASFSTNVERMARFEREARLLAALNHPHIGAIYGIAETNGVRGLVLELVEGDTLRERIALRLTPREALSIAAQIADALDLAHEKGIVHRDLKPDNVKVAPDGTVKVLDFGIAKMSGIEDGSSTPTLTSGPGTLDGILMGTAAFMSPEQARGKSVDKRADIWSFGCVLYEMFAGRRAFPGDTASDTIVSILDREPDWSALPQDTPSNIRRLIKRCLVKDVRKRLRDIGDARVEIDDALLGVPESPGSGTARRSGASPAPWILSAALVAALGVVLWRDRSPAATSVTTPPKLVSTVRLTNTPEREFGPAISPDGKWVAYYSDARGPTDIWVKYLDSGATLNLTSSLGMQLPVRTNLGGLAISPDGKNLAFFASGDPTQVTYDTWVIPAPLGGLPHRLLQGTQGAQWSPDGKQLAYIVPGSALGDALVVAGADGSSPREVVRPDGGHHVHWPTWSPDGQSIYFVYTFQPFNTEPAEIYRVPVSGGAIEPVVRTIRRAVYPATLPNGDLVFSANPDSVALGLWWQSARGGAPQRLTTGLGEYAEPRVSGDGRRLVSMVTEMRQSLVSLTVSDASPVMRTLTDGYGGDLEPSRDPTSDRMVFSSARSGHRNLWIMRQDGSDARPLTSDTSNDHHPAFSPDGRQIAFVSDRGGQWGIWLISAEGGAARLLAPAIVLDCLTWSRDGTQILYATPGGERPTVLASVSVADGKTRPFLIPGAAVAPSWSPASDVIAYLEPMMERQADASAVPKLRIGLRFVDGQGRPTFTNIPFKPLQNGLVAWAPDGRRIAMATVPANAPASIWIVEPTAPTPFKQLMTLKPNQRPRGLTWTTDGARLIIATEESLSDLVLHELGR